jgi:hypothetical protein
VRTGLLQSMPSHNIESCARVNEMLPLSAFGHTNRPLSKRIPPGKSILFVGFER